MVLDKRLNFLDGIVTRQLFTLVFSFILGLYFSHLYYSDKIAQQELKNNEAIKQQQKHISDLSIYWYQKLNAPVEPTVITERVFTKAHCVSESGDSGMGERGTASRVELDPEVVGRLAGVGDEEEAKYKACYVRLQFYNKLLSDP